jgi:hypothetical protein
MATEYAHFASQRMSARQRMRWVRRQQGFELVSYVYEKAGGRQMNCQASTFEIELFGLEQEEDFENFHDII